MGEHSAESYMMDGVVTHLFRELELLGFGRCGVGVSRDFRSDTFVVSADVGTVRARINVPAEGPWGYYGVYCYV